MTDSSSRFDVVVIGGGIVGCSIAYELSLRGLDVALLEASTVGSGTSGNSFAWINGTSKIKSEAYHRLNAAGTTGYRKLARQWGEKKIGLHPGGTLEWASPRNEANLDEIRAKADKLRSWDYPVAWVGRAELSAMEPHVEFEPDAEGLYAVADPWLDVPVYLSFLLERLRENGASIREHTRVSELLVNDEGKILGVQCNAGRLDAEQVVVAAGPGTADVLTELTGYEGFASRFPMTRAPGLLVTTPNDPDHQWASHILYAAAHDIHVRPGASGGLLLGSDEIDGMIEEDSDPATLRTAAIRLLEKATRLMPTFAGPELVDECNLRIGVRAVPADGDSIAGPLPSAEGLHIVCTHSGVTLGPEISRLMADSIQSGQVPDEILPFGLERFQM